MMLSTRSPLRAVLFDLDGTLADTAADLCGAANAMRVDAGRDPLPLADFRPWVSRGGRAMLEIAFPDWDEATRAARLPEFLARYADQVCVHSRLFAGMDDVLLAIEDAGWRWGIVTNKPIALAVPVVAGLGLESRCAVLLGGDSLAERKPHPLPLLTACERMAIDTGGALYVGDDLRDVQAARAAGMPVIAAGWGYIPPGESAADWQADLVLQEPRHLLGLPGLRG